jgi:hypothetical protein
MAGNVFTSKSFSIGDKLFNGGLNTTSGPLGLQDNESSDLQNIDFDKFGSLLKRNGYSVLNSSAISGTPSVSALHWYEYVSGGTATRKLLSIAGTKIFKMDDLDGTWDDITGAITITTDKKADFSNFLNEVYITNNTNAPFKWNGTGNVSAMSVPTGLTRARCIAQFNNYLFLANVVVSGGYYKSRLYWCNINDTATWVATNFIIISKDDGQEIIAIKTLADRLVIYKERAIYNVFFTGDPDIPFIVRKSNSSVGCIAQFSVQEVENGHVFLSYDGLYYYDGNNSYKISDKITNTLIDLNTARFTSACSLVQKNKNRYWLSLTDTGSIANDIIIVWDYFHKAFSLYSGIDAASLATVYVDGVTEQVYFGDYGGFVYRADNGVNDNPAGVATAIDAYYWSNWRHLEDLISSKAITQANLYYNNSNCVLTFAYSYDFDEGIQVSTTFSLATSAAVYGTAIYDTDVYGNNGGSIRRIDLDGRGKVFRFKMANNILSETFRIDGLGLLAHQETNV